MTNEFWSEVAKMGSTEKAAIIAGAFTLINALIQAISRLISHGEHKKTEGKVDKVLVFMNGGLEERIKKAVQEAINKK